MRDPLDALLDHLAYVHDAHYDRDVTLEWLREEHQHVHRKELEEAGERA